MAVDNLGASILRCVVFSVFSCGVIFCNPIQINLEGTWIVTNANKSLSVYGNVPGNVHTALYHNGTIMDPYFRFNDVVYRWIAYDNWTYTRDIEVSEDLIAKKKILMVCQGLDTVATILVNNVIVGQSDNMFQRYILDIKGALKAGLNSIKVRFLSAVLYAKEKSQSYSYPVPPECPVPVQRGECHGNFIRKEQCSFSWDWGPAFVSQGIWRNISLQAYNSAVIRDLMITPIKGSGGSAGITWQLLVKVFVDAAEDGVTGTLVLSLPQLSRTEKLPVKLLLGLQEISFPKLSFTEKDNVLVWWPRGYGKQNLYTVKVVFISSSDDEQSNITRQMGFRKVKLVQEKIKDSPGRGFHFEVNDFPIFLKGANWIPADAFEDRVTTPVLRNLLMSAVDANMNVVRNWGGGIYQHDEFYDIADELGLLVWEEFMFACAMYPTNEEFLKSVQEEVRYQVRRLHHHPSIIVWSGNNENEVALVQNWYGTITNYPRYVKDYVKLYIDIIRETLEKEDTSRPFLSSSPSNGVETEKEGWLAKNPGSPYWGDVHFYDYEMDCWNVGSYPKPRFASEYGFQSYPSFETLAEVSIKEDWSYDSAFMDHRQHHAYGNKEMLDQAKKHYKLPNSSDPLKKYKDTLFITQVAQAQCMKMETEHYRRLQSEIVQGQGKTMGTIYWQLNSIWQAPTWSSLEYGGRWKLLHYFAKNFYAPVISSAYQEGANIKLYVISDLVKPITNGSVVLTAWSWSSLKALHIRRIPFSINNQSSALIYEDELKDVLRESGCESPLHCVLTMRPEDLTSGRDLGPTNVFYPSSLSVVVGLTDPLLKIVTVKQMSRMQFSLTVRAQFPACLVWLNAGKIKGRFSDNGFLQTEQIRTVTFYSWQDTTGGELTKNLHVSSLYDLYE